MMKLRSRFSRKLHLVFATMLAVTLGLAWYFYDSVRWYEHDMQRIALANDVLQAYQELSRGTHRELGDLSLQVFAAKPLAPDQLAARDLRLREALSRVRQGITEEVAFERSAGQGQELESLESIERVIEELIRTRQDVNLALGEERLADAQSAMIALSQSGISEHFNTLIRAALDGQRLEVYEAERQAVTLAQYITSVLPVFMTTMVVLTLLVVVQFSRSLARSVGALHEGVRAFTAGNLAHRIPTLRDREFWRLGEAFNTMARQLSEHRKELHDANVSLEAKIEERTRALQSSNRKLADVDVTRRKLLADISHEFRTPLTVIRGEAEIALRAGSRDSDDYRDAFRRIVDQADHTTRLVDDLLFIARADAGEPRLDLRTVPVGKLLDQLCEEFTAKAAERDIRIDFRCSDPEALVKADSGRLRQVFFILLDNAVRYSHRGGDVEVRLDRLDQEVVVAITDHGIGLTEEEAEQAFERFYRGNQAEAHARGNGLGLPVARAIVEVHHGRITLEGKPGEGATARVTLPAESRFRVVA